jgi:hypothetical protein
MTELKELQNEFNKLCDEQEGLYHGDFEKVFKCLFKLDKTLTKNIPCTTNGADISKALKMAGFEKDKDFCNAFKRYNEIFIAGKEIQRKIIKMIPRPLGINLVMIKGVDISNLQILEKPEPVSEGWQFYPKNIIAPEPLMNTAIDGLKRDAAANKGLFSNMTDIPEEDESLDRWFEIEAYGLKCSLEPLYRELQHYKILDSILKYKTIKSYFLKTLKCTLIEFIKENTDKPNKVRNHIIKTLKELDGIPVFGLLLQILLLQGLIKWFEGVDLKEDDVGFNEACILVQWISKHLIEKEVKFCYFFWGKADKEYLKPFCDYLYSTDIGKGVQTGLIEFISKNNEKIASEFQPEQQPELTRQAVNLPKELDTNEAKRYFTQAIEKGLMSDEYKWLKSKALLSYFADKASEYLNLGKGEYDGKTKITWKPFETLFGIKGLSGAKRDYQKTGNSPEGYRDVDKLFK